MFAPRRLQELACGAFIPWVIQDPIVRIVSHLRRVIELVYVRLAIFLRA